MELSLKPNKWEKFRVETKLEGSSLRIHFRDIGDLAHPLFEEVQKIPGVKRFGIASGEIWVNLEYRDEQGAKQTIDLLAVAIKKAKERAKEDAILINKFKELIKTKIEPEFRNEE